MNLNNTVNVLFQVHGGVVEVLQIIRPDHAFRGKVIARSKNRKPKNGSAAFR